MFSNNWIYYRFNKKKIEKALLKLKRITIDIVYEILTKNCWNYHIQYEVILKDKYQLEIKLIGEKEIYLFKFHKRLVIEEVDYQKFINLCEIVQASKGIYITTGIFNKNVQGKNRHFIFIKKANLVDGYSFIKSQIWLREKKAPHNSYKNLEFFRYLPA